MTGAPKAAARNYGIDLLKMISMQMIVLLHVLGVGGVLENLPELSAGYDLGWLLESACYCAVNCFALSTGYLMCGSKVRYHRLLQLWLQVVFYTVGITAFFALWRPELATAVYWKAAFRPVSASSYWYFTAYFAMYLFIPFFNKLLDVLSKKELERLITSGVLLLMVTFLAKADIFRLHGGYTAVWLGFLYFFGAYFRKYPIERKTSAGRYLFGYACMVLLAWGCKLGGLMLQDENGALLVWANNLYSYVSPVMLAASVFLFQAMQQLKFQKKWMQKLVSTAAPAAFSVYLVHCHPLVWHNLLAGRFAGLAALPLWKMIPMILLAGMGIYMVCTAADLVRIRLFGLLDVSRRCRDLGKWCAERIEKRTDMNR